MKILVTGAAGFIGAALVRALAARPAIDGIVATDQGTATFKEPAVQFLAGDITDRRFTQSLIGPGVDVVFHLASLVSGGAEQDFELGTKVNLDATRDLLEACRLAGHCPRFVFTSSIAVYGGELPDPVTDDTPPAPRLSYGAQKLVCELLINDYTRRGFADGRALRLPGVLVRPGSANTAVTGWSSAIIREPLAGRDYVCPVRPDTRIACISVGRVIESLLHAAALAADALGANRTVLLTGISATAAELWEAARPHARARVTFQPDSRIQAIMDTGAKATFSARAQRLGFRHNASVDEIVAECVQTLAAS